MLLADLLSLHLVTFFNLVDKYSCTNLGVHKEMLADLVIIICHALDTKKRGKDQLTKNNTDSPECLAT